MAANTPHMNDQEYKIEKGVPIPERGNSAKWAPLTSKMKAGDSVVVETRANSAMIYLALIRTHGARSACVRKCEGGWRVWRIK